MRILYLVSRLREGGPSNQLRYIIKHLGPAYEPVVLTLSPEESPSARPKFESEGIDVHSLGYSRYEGLVRGPSALRRFVNKLQPDVVHTQGLRPDLLAALFLRSVPRVAILRNYPFDDYVSKFGRLRGTIMAKLHLWALRQIDIPVACSYTVQRAVAKHELTLRVVQNGIDASAYAPVESTEEKQHLRRRFDLPEDRPVFVSVGLLIPRKDPQRLIRGFHQSSGAEEGVLVMLGDGPLLEECKREAEAGEGEVRFPGFVDHVAAYLQAADYFISTSRSEGLPNTVMEALGAGLPVLLSDIPSHREILRRETQAGRLFELEDPSELARSIEALLCEDKTELRTAARAVIEAHFNASRISQEYQEIYRSIVQ